VGSARSLAVLRAVARPLYSRARATITVSESLRRDMLGAGFSGSIEVIPNIVRKFEINHASNPIPGRLLAVGSLTKTKNQALALQTLAMLPLKYSLDIVGEGPERPALEQLVDELGLADRVVLHGYLSDPTEQFAGAQIVIHPSLGETYGLVLFEAAEFRRPVVAANQSAMAEMIPQLVPGLVAEPQPDAFANAILSLDTAPLTAQDYDEAARRRAQISKGIEDDWKRLINSAAL